MRPSETLQAQNIENWTAATQHDFTAALADGSLAPEKMRAYLEQDYLFVEGFVQLLAAAVSHAPSLEDALPGARFLGLIAGEENTYFERALAALGADPTVMARPAPVTRGFQDLMGTAARSGSYAKMLAVLVVAEWVYLDWAQPYEAKAGDLPFYFGEWITLHAGPGFEGVVAYLRGQFDAAFDAAAQGERAEIEQLFARAVALERGFFDAAYSGNWAGQPVPA
ncbi:MAG: TenA family protein [Mangrovicoccus sp.]|nr:TenA family protein [Mangrovicoccus sp.]